MNWADYEADIASSKPRRFETWRPVEGDSLIGRVVALRTITTKFGKQRVADLEREGNGVLTVFLSTVLRRQFAEPRISESDVVGIRFHGKGTSKTGQPFNVFTTKVYERNQKQQEDEPSYTSDDYDDDLPL